MDIKVIEVQLNLLSSLQTNYLRQKETATYWAQLIGKQILELSNLHRSEKEKQKNTSDTEKIKSKINTDLELKDQKVNLLLEELFKTLKSK